VLKKIRKSGRFESSLDLHKKTRKSIGVGTNKKAPKAGKRIIYFSALGTFANLGTGYFKMTRGDTP
jgi:hypothetical protein